MDPINILIVAVILPAALVVGAVLRSSGRQRESVTARGRAARPDGNLELAVRGLLRGPHPQKIMAIKVVRERTGMRLKDAKDYVDAIERGTERPGAGMNAHDDQGSHDVADGVVRAVQAGSGTKIEAIKRVRDATGMGLKDAKNFVDAHWV